MINWDKKSSVTFYALSRLWIFNLSFTRPADNICSISGRQQLIMGEANNTL